MDEVEEISKSKKEKPTLAKKDLSDYPEPVKKIFNIMTISSTYRVVGSAGLKHAKYFADYDLNETYEKSKSTGKSISMLEHIRQLFLEKFATIEKDKRSMIIDFKCGIDEDGNPIRWSHKDLKKGFKELESGRKIKFVDCILMKSTMKLDVISVIDGKLTEFSDNYFINLGGEDANYFPTDFSKEVMLNSIRHSYAEYLEGAQNYFKALKRAFAYYKLDNEEKHHSKLINLLEFFNSDVGRLYKIKSEIDTIGEVLKEGTKKLPASLITNNLKLILDGLGSIKDSSVGAKLEKAIKATKIPIRILYVEEASDELLKLINHYTLEFIAKNKNLLINSA